MRQLLQLLEAQSNAGDRPSKPADVNRYLKQNGYGDYRIYAGRGYYYVDSKNGGKFGDPAAWKSNSIFTYRVSNMTLGDWLQAFIDLANENKDRW
jgi:hypothetical protein